MDELLKALADAKENLENSKIEYSRKLKEIDEKIANMKKTYTARLTDDESKALLEKTLETAKSSFVQVAKFDLAMAEEWVTHAEANVKSAKEFEDKAGDAAELFK